MIDHAIRSSDAKEELLRTNETIMTTAATIMSTSSSTSTDCTDRKESPIILLNDDDGTCTSNNNAADEVVVTTTSTTSKGGLHTKSLPTIPLKKSSFVSTAVFPFNPTRSDTNIITSTPANVTSSLFQSMALGRSGPPPYVTTATASSATRSASTSGSGSGSASGSASASASASTELPSINFKEIDRIFYIAALISTVTWLALMVCVYFVCEKDDWVYLQAEERWICQVAIAVYMVAATMHLSKIFLKPSVVTTRTTSTNKVGDNTAADIRSKNKDTIHYKTTSAIVKWFQKTLTLPEGSGIIVAGLTVQFVSFATNCLLAFAPTPVMVDPITHSRVFLFRWCEWIPTAGLMTFLCEGLDVDIDTTNDDENENENGHVDNDHVDNENDTHSEKKKGEKENDNADYDPLIHKRRESNNNNNNNKKNCTTHKRKKKSTHNPTSLRAIIVWSLSQSLSCVSGILFPFCTDMITWNIAMLFSMVTYICIFPRVLIRRKLYLDVVRKQEHHQEAEFVAVSAAFEKLKQTDHSMLFDVAASCSLLLEQELVERRRFSYYLLLSCCILWTGLVAVYFVNMMLHLYPIESIFTTIVPKSSLAMMCDTSFDVIAKIVYMRLIVDVYMSAFDPSGRVQRQLHELRGLVSAIWQSSSDVIAISVRINEHSIVSVLSPSFTLLFSGSGSGSGGGGGGSSNSNSSSTNIDGSASEVPYDSLTGNINTIQTKVASTHSSPSHGKHDDKFPLAALILELERPPVQKGKQRPRSASKNEQESEYRILSAYYVDSSSFSIPNFPVSSETILSILDLNNHAVVEASRIVLRSLNSSRNSSNPFSNSNNNSSNNKNNNNKLKRNKNESTTTTTTTASLTSESGLEYFPLINAVGEKLICEMKVSRHAENAVVAVVRDVTERDRRFEAERKAHAETLARQRDAQAANRFTRHEVKNGLLAGIELCDNMRTSLEVLKSMVIKEVKEVVNEIFHCSTKNGNGTKEANSNAATAPTTNTTTTTTTISGNNDAETNALMELMLSQRIDAIVQVGCMQHVTDIDKMLQEVLETILTEAMAREVVHEVYVPRMERVNIPSVLDRSETRSKRAVYPIEVIGKDTMPELLLDIQLLNYIHRNAVSNACKYGKLGGTVATKVWYNRNEQILTLQISNEPGTGHQELLEMGDAATHAVFQQGVRLQPHNKGAVNDVRASSGDGAWIMQKCAMTLGGKCSIQFLPDETVFTFSCPAVPAPCDNSPDYRDFRVSQNTWGIAFDDSHIQRKLMDRILANVGIDDKKRILMGENATDVKEFVTKIQTILTQDDECRVLILMDENLDYISPTNVPILVSGSSIVNDILNDLPSEYEKRVLALIRSANDSAEEISWYSDRSHGFFPKATVQRDRVCEILAPLWEQRFYPTTAATNSNSNSLSTSSSSSNNTNSNQASSLSSSSSAISHTSGLVRVP